MNEPLLTLTGNVASDVRTSTTESGVTRAAFRLAATPRRFDRAAGEWADQETFYLGVTAWRATAEHVARSLAKGDPVLVTGRLRQRSWTTPDGRSGVDLELSAEAVGHDLSRGVSRFTRAGRPRADGDPEPAADATVGPAAAD